MGVINFDKNGTGKFNKNEFAWSLISSDTLIWIQKSDIQNQPKKIKFNISETIEKGKNIQLELTSITESGDGFVLCRGKGDCE